ncbi:Hypothetical protein NTJ_01475 [Nesidiocoris tenuis]|uniref:Uncharacterized protein n=1 Tax=Nesidiocoris tenuis TaxID=355587 RepID=A0ABN7A9K4_9HEMI|nr:Hypothetical protein NTJ_01475 [Nesidiocoris tenuis]
MQVIQERRKAHRPTVARRIRETLQKIPIRSVGYGRGIKSTRALEMLRPIHGLITYALRIPAYRIPVSQRNVLPFAEEYSCFDRESDSKRQG